MLISRSTCQLCLGGALSTMLSGHISLNPLACPNIFRPRVVGHSPCPSDSPPSGGPFLYWAVGHRGTSQGSNSGPLFPSMDVTDQSTNQLLTEDRPTDRPTDQPTTDQQTGRPTSATGGGAAGGSATGEGGGSYFSLSTSPSPSHTCPRRMSHCSWVPVRADIDGM